MLFFVLFYAGYHRYSLERSFAAAYNATFQPQPDVNYPDSLNTVSRSMQHNYKWLFTTLFILLYVAVTLSIVFIVFPIPKVLLVMAEIYGGLFFISLIAFVGGYIFENHMIGLGLIQQIKRIIQSPLPALIFILYFWKINPVIKVQ